MNTFIICQWHKVIHRLEWRESKMTEQDFKGKKFSGMRELVFLHL
ncbi:hypothetical protein SUNDANCE_170 [Brevibacillus phage Sundance]|nr:hypothetical protein AVT09_gp170 [Brevibacillus phage Sundance]ALA47986.1 hypothetical protein SUNDANCE_170 [Brevibacillus phage Sundance]